MSILDALRACSGVLHDVVLATGFAVVFMAMGAVIGVAARVLRAVWLVWRDRWRRRKSDDT